MSLDPLVSNIFNCDGLVPIICTVNTIRETPSQFENWIMARMYVRSNTRCTMYRKAPFCLPELAYRKLVLLHIKINYSDYPKSLISRINEVSAFSIKYRIEKKNTYISFKPLVLLHSHLLLCSCSFCDVSVTLYTFVTSASRYHPRYQSLSLTYIRGLIPRNFAELAEAVQRV